MDQGRAQPFVVGDAGVVQGEREASLGRCVEFGMRPVAGMDPHHVSDRRELPGVRIGPAQHLAPEGGQSFGVLRMQARMAERMLGLGVGEAAMVPRVGESEHRGSTTGGLVDTDVLTGRRGHGKNVIADRRLGPDTCGSSARD